MSVISVKVEGRGFKFFALEGKTDTALEGARVVGGRDQRCSCSSTNSDYNLGGTQKVQPDPAVRATLEDIKEQRVILEAIKDHLIAHISEKTGSKEMYNFLVSLFQSDNMSRKMILRTKLREYIMTNSDNVTNYLMRIT
jgi:hypothetical protein